MFSVSGRYSSEVFQISCLGFNIFHFRLKEERTTQVVVSTLNGPVLIENRKDMMLNACFCL